MIWILRAIIRPTAHGRDGTPSRSSLLYWLPPSFNPSSTLLHLHQPSLHPSISLNDLPCPWSPPCFTPSTSVLLSFSLRPPSSHRPPSLSIQPLWAVSTHLTSTPCLLPINFGADGRALLSLCELDWQGLVINLHRRPVICRSAPTLLSIVLSFKSPLPCSPPNLLFSLIFILALLYPPLPLLLLCPTCYSYLLVEC